MQQQSVRFYVLMAVVLGVVLGHQPITEVLVDRLWFGALGMPELFRIPLLTKLGLWLGGFAASAAFIAANLRYASRRAPVDYLRLSALMGDQPVPPEQLASLARWLGLGWVVLPSMMFANLAASRWLDVLTFLNGVPFDKVDPVFNRDIGFYTYELPVIATAQDAASGLIFLTLFPLAAFYGLRELANGPGERLSLPAFARAHLLGLGGLLFASAAAGWWIQRFELLFSQTGIVWGMGYADVNAALPAAGVMAVLSLGIAVALFAAARQEGWTTPVTAVGVYIVAQALLAGAWPALMQEYFVKPSELTVEREFLERNIEATRAAYALDRIDVKPFEAAADLTMDAVDANPLTLNNVRVWDDRPLLETYRQIQEIRTYYEFQDVDIDRYTIDDQLRQVMLSARELSYDSVPEQAKGWVNEHILYTHGYGLTMSPVNVVTPEGLPELFVQDLPPQASIDLPVERPEIYYGELTDHWVLVKTSEQELDYPLGDENVYTTYAGDGGVGIGGFGRKLLFSLYFDNLDILLSQYLQSDSRVMLRRNIMRRVEALAPFLRFDEDPYLVVADGKLWWILDAYTTTRAYPYSEPTSDRERLGDFNYIRNSVKVVIDAYHGSVSFYIADESDPLIRTYAGLFPEVFQPLSAMPQGLAAHLRYPVDFFNQQARMFQAYHMVEPTVFYNKEDMWDFPKELYGQSGSKDVTQKKPEQQMRAYYLIMKLPDSERAEFILLIPFVPNKKDNLISWLAARCDPDDYGRMVLYQFPKQKLVYGPRQIEARIDQDPTISQEITLWSQSGSDVIRGNLLVIPIEDSLMYVEPLYLKAETGELPELKRVIVSHNNRIAMEETLGEALAAVFGARAKTVEGSPEAQADEQARQALEGWGALAVKASDAYQTALARQREGDWAGYGEALDELEALLAGLEAAAREGEVPEGLLPEAPSEEEGGEEVDGGGALGEPTPEVEGE
ncbi:MAG: UPF0182 family protein [Alphaproteobacteria bacterium]|nr:UPF0182 family protein [Alphaproteobacteria bacterium]MCB9794030.1 UPF0182 family protein [Alphaproteobacteria bacterium]